MKILVTASVVPDIYSVVRPSDDGTGAVVQASSLTVNPADPVKSPVGAWGRGDGTQRYR